MLYHIFYFSVVLGPSDHDKFLDEKLNEVASEVTNFEPRLRKKNVSAAEIKVNSRSN